MHKLQAGGALFRFFGLITILSLGHGFAWSERGIANESQSIQDESESGLSPGGDSTPAFGRSKSSGELSRFAVQTLDVPARRIDELVSRQYDVCNKHPNSYEKAFESHPLANPRPLERNLSPVCTLEAMKLDRKSMRSCSRASGRSSPEGIEHCVGPKYHHVVHNALALSLKCLNVDPAGVIPMFVGESGMRLNEVSDSGARGIGQLMPSTIDYLNKQKPRMLQILEQSRDPKCAEDLAPLIRKETLPSSPTCAAILPPSRVVLNLFYGIWHIREAERLMAETVYDHLTGAKILQKSLAVERLDAVLLEKLKAKGDSDLLGRSRCGQLATEQRRTQCRAMSSERRQKLAQQEITTLNTEMTEIQRAIAEQRVRHVMQNPQTRRLLRVASVYGYNFGNFGFRDLLRTFLEDVMDEGASEAMDLTERLHAWLRENASTFVAGQNKREEMLNHIERLTPGGRGDAVTIQGKAGSLNQAVSAVLGENDLKGVGPCDELY